MRALLIAYFFPLSLVSFSQEKSNSWYKCMKGTIDKFPITMHLHKAEHYYSGCYYYATKEDPIYFFGDDTSKKRVVELHAMAGTNEDPRKFFQVLSMKKKIPSPEPGKFTGNPGRCISF